MPKKKGGGGGGGGGAASTSSASAMVPAGPAAPMSKDIADMLAKKIQEFENTSKEKEEKTVKAQKATARAVAKTKTKEAKQLMGNAELSEPEKIVQLQERLTSEHEQAMASVSEAVDRRVEIDEAEKERDSCQEELNRTLGVKSKLETLCRRMRQQTDVLVEERRRLTDRERQRRQDLADEFQSTIGDVKKTMDQQAQERARLARENEELREQFKKFFEQYDKREKERLEQQKHRELEVQILEPKLAEQTNLFRMEAAKEVTAKRENEELIKTEQVLREQLATYSNKFNHFQEALSKSDKVLGQYKRQRNKMLRRVELLEKENTEIKNKNERRTTQVLKEKDSVSKDKVSLQEKCKTLQAERQRLLDEVQKLQPDGLPDRSPSHSPSPMVAAC